MAHGIPVNRWSKVPGKKNPSLSEHSTRPDQVYSADSAVSLISTFSKVKNLDAHSFFFTKMTLNWLLIICSTLDSGLPRELHYQCLPQQITAACFVLSKEVRTEAKHTSVYFNVEHLDLRSCSLTLLNITVCILVFRE